ncbi:MAG TPA: SDR family NAD(P)-dependent oxidoreductase [Acidothermaceae bacterium]
MSVDTTRLDGKTALVVGGGGGGIGRAVSTELAGAGARVVVVDVELDRAKGVCDDITAEGHIAVPMQADMLDSATVEALVDEVCASYEGIDVLATIVGGVRGLAPWQPAHRYTDKQWQDVLDLNLTSAFIAVRAVLTRMLDRGQGGSIIAIGSLSGIAGSPQHFAYGVGKAGVIHMARSIAIEYGQQGIRMNVVSPGRVRTPATSDTLNEAQLATFAERIPLGRIGEAEDIASAVRFFASPASSYISGQNLMVDGGATARFPIPLPGTSPHESF